MPPKAAPKPPAPATALGKPIMPPCQVTRIRLSPDGKILAAACIDGAVRRWNVSGKTPEALPDLKGHHGWVTALAYGDGSILSGDSWGRLAAWDMGGKPKWSVPAHDGWLRMLAVSKDGTVATCGKDHLVRTWDKAGRKTAELHLESEPYAVCFSPNGKTLFVGDLLGIVRECDLPSGKAIRTFDAKELYKLHRIQDVGGVRCLLFDPSGKALLVAGAIPSTGASLLATPLLIAFDRNTGKRLWEWKGASPNDGFITDLAWHAGGYLIGSSSGQPGQGKVFFLKPGEEKPFFIVSKPNVHGVAIHPDGARFVAALTNANSNGNGRVKGAKGEYLTNTSPLQFWQIGK